MTDKKSMTKLKFMPGAFDNFEGTQEELDELVDEITQMANDDSFYENATVVNLDNLEESDPELWKDLVNQISQIMGISNDNEPEIDDFKKKMN